MYKSFLRLLCVVMLMASFASVSTAQDGPIELTFLHIFSGITGDQVNAAVDAFNASQDDIIVTAEVAEGSYEGILERLQLGAVVGDLPDVTLTGLTYTQFAIENLPVVPIQTFVDSEGLDLDPYFPQLLDLGRDSNGDLFGMPFVISNPVMFYNVPMFEEAGLAVPTTVEEVREVAMQLTDASNEQFGVFYDYTVTGNWIFQALVESYGGTMLDADGRAAFNSEEGQAALQYLVDLVMVDQTMPVSNTQQALQLFVSGRLGMVITSSAGTGLIDSLSEFEVGVAPFPLVNDNRTIPAGGNNLVVIDSGDAERQQASWEFIKFMTSAEVNGPLANSIGYMTVHQDAVNTPGIIGDILAEDERFQVPYDQLPDTVPWYNMSGDIGTRVYSIVQDNIDAALTGQKSVDEALSDAQEQINNSM
jgi:multiple sugar transport system substrate-binding protein